MSKRGERLLFMAILIFVFLPLQTSSPANAESKWNPISSQDYIFGYTSFKFACWSGTFNAENSPSLQVFDNSKWVDVAKGQVLPVGSDISTPCETTHPIAIGYQWTFMNPAPPLGLTGSARYSVLYRQKLPDLISKVSVLVTKSVPQDVLKSRDVLKTVPQIVNKIKNVKKIVKTPYIASVIRNGKKENVIKYKSEVKLVPVKYTETKMIDKLVTETYIVNENVLKEVYENQDKVTPGYTTENGNVVVYPSMAAFNQYTLDLVNGLACSFGFSSSCKK
jgi:hypothetical protein